jgi:hypothetical protein
MKHVFFIFCILVLVSSLLGQVPNKISYQGLLTTSSGTPVQDGSYNLQFDIYNLPSGGSIRYTETQNGISVQRGTFNVFLSPSYTVFSESLFVEVTGLSGPSISTPITFSPRSRLTSAPYSLNAAQINGAVIAMGTWFAGSTTPFVSFHGGHIDVSGTGLHDDKLRFKNNSYSEVRVAVMCFTDATSSMTTVWGNTTVDIPYPHWAPFMVIIGELAASSDWTTVMWCSENDGNGSYLAINHNK